MSGSLSIMQGMQGKNRDRAEMGTSAQECSRRLMGHESVKFGKASDSALEGVTPESL